MKVLFVYTNITGFHRDNYSFGLASILSSTRAAGHETAIEIVKTKEEYKKVLDSIDLFKPQIVGFTAVSSQYCFVKELAEKIKQKAPDTICVCGGVHPTINPNCITESEALDGIFRGDCESSFVDFVNTIEKGEDYKKTDNYCYVKNGTVKVNVLRPLVHDLDLLPYSDRDQYPIEEQMIDNSMPFFFSRGCPYPCAYCSNHALAAQYGLKKSAIRYRSPESCIQEIEVCMKKFPSMNTLSIGDDIFGINKEWRNEFCELYQKRINIRFYVLLRANLVDEEFLTLLKKAGCYSITYGVESGNEYIRNKVMKRTMSQEKIIEVFDMTHKFGIKTTALNIIGVPGETEEMLWDTIKLNQRIKPTNSGINIFYPYRGTVLGDRCFKENLVDLDMYYDFSNERRESVMGYEKKWKEKLVYYKDNWERLVYGKDYYIRALKYGLMKTPLWPPLVAVKRKTVNMLLAMRH